jgi:hypothetical protein
MASAPSQHSSLFNPMKGKTMAKLTSTVLIFAFALAACNKPDASPASPSGPASGNALAKKEGLSSGNASDIRADLASLNAIVNKSNSEAMAQRERLMSARKSGDQAAIQSEMAKIKSHLENNNSVLMGLSVKSNEVQALRVQMIDGNTTALEMSTLSMKKDKTPDELQRIQALQKRSAALQQLVGKTLDELNARYK